MTNPRRTILYSIIGIVLLIVVLRVVQLQRAAQAGAEIFVATARQNAALTEGAVMTAFYEQLTLTARP